MFTLHVDWYGKIEVEHVNFFKGEFDSVLAKEFNITTKKLQNGLNKCNCVRNGFNGPSYFKTPEDAEKAIDWLESIRLAEELNPKKKKKQE